MKRNLAIVLSVVFIFALFQMSSLKLSSNSAQPQAGFAGDPGRTTCNNCHLGSTRTDASKFTLRIAQTQSGLSDSSSIITAGTQYTPGATNWVSLELNGTNGPTTKYGFQLTALDSADNSAGTFTVVDATNTSVENAGAQPTSRKYVGHKAANGTVHQWTFQWAAPSNVGPITFYYTGNIANGDGVEYLPGDSVYEGNATLAKGLPLGIADIPSAISAISTYPMPFSHSLTAEMNLDRSGPLTISLVSMEGATVRDLYQADAPQGRFSHSFDLNDISAGVYLLRMQSGSSTQVVRIMKL